MEEAMLGLNTVSMSNNDAMPLAYSDASTGYANHAKKRPRKPLNAPSTKYKGVVPQQNGHWGAQIYANHQRIWLGTFKSEKEAAMAYDSASLKLRSGESHRNIPWSVLTVEEPYFQRDHSTEAVLNMIRDGSYPSKFTDFVRSRSRQEIGKKMNPTKVRGDGMFSFRLLFQKELTPSDVGKLNRLVIPKKYAVRYFPRISECDNEKENIKDNKMKELLLNFHDGLMRSWKFRYCYWSSSQSFVFTRGWSRFVKEKELQANDVISFYICEPTEKKPNPGQFYLIDVAYKQDKNTGRKADLVVPCSEKMESLNQDIEKSSYTDECEDEVEGNKISASKTHLSIGLEQQHHKTKQSCFRLFGVDIN